MQHKNKNFESHFFSPFSPKVQWIEFGQEESHHMVKVFRLQKGVTIRIANGNGQIVEGIIQEISPTKCCVQVTNMIIHETTPPRLHLGMACLKDNDLEFVMDSCAQLPLTSLTLLRTDYSQEPRQSDLKKIRRRLETKAIVALKQCRKPWLTQIHGPFFFKDFLQNHPHQLVVCDERGSLNPQTALSALPPQGDITVLVGPEGGFSPEELERLTQQHQARFLGLGPYRLRAHTAPIVALSRLLEWA